MRDLASVCTISETFPLEGKDKVHGIRMVENAYEAMVSKDIKEGDLVAFIQEGALLPETSTWEFLRNLKCYNESEKAFLIKVKKFKEIKSWGLVLKLDEIGLSEKEIKKLKAGDDITDLLKIRKHEPKEDASPVRLSKAYPNWVKFCLKHTATRWVGRIWQKAHTNSKDSAAFPTEYITKSDETTIQNYKYVIEKFRGSPCYVTMKLEGQSFTAMIDPKKNKFFVCSRNNAYKKENPGNVFWYAAKRYSIEERLFKYLKDTGKYLILQGEQCGPSIQENIYHLHETKWFVYTMKEFDPRTRKTRQLSWDEMVEVSANYGIKLVPFVGKYDKFSEICPSIEEAVAFAENQFFKISKDNSIEFIYTPKAGEKLWVDYAQHEGVVIRSLDYDKDANIGFSIKVKNIDYAEKGLGKIAAIKW